MKPSIGTIILGTPQKIYRTEHSLSCIQTVLESEKARRPFLVCGGSARRLEGWDILKECANLTIFSDFQPNPTYESVVAGTALFRSSQSDFLISIGGGSAIDVAKTIKLFAAMQTQDDDPSQAHYASPVKHLAIPTTAGTGSESTKFSVVYKNGEKQSIENACMTPEVVLLDAALLSSLPLYQKKCAAFDAIGQCIESIWAKGAGVESRNYAKQGLALALHSLESYLSGDPDAAADMLLAANLSGRAICLSRTTAAHAMSYGISALCRIPHGHAVALTLPAVWQQMINCFEDPAYRDDFGSREALRCICDSFGCKENANALRRYVDLRNRYLSDTPAVRERDLSALTKTVNAQRLGNMPIPFSESDLLEMYASIFKTN